MHQTTHTLPKSRWQSVTIIESNDPVVRIYPSGKLKISNPDVRARSRLIDMLQNAAESLPDNLCLQIIEGVRSMEDQKTAWDQSYAKMQVAYPDKDDEFWQTQTGLLVARPSPLANHNCGGAVDVQLLYKDSDEPVDMGTLPKAGFGYELTQMFSNKISETQTQNRMILREAMEQAGFVWYPGEWWHYCYGDRMWAVYTNRTECFYGPIQDVIQ